MRLSGKVENYKIIHQSLLLINKTLHRINPKEE